MKRMNPGIYFGFTELANLILHRLLRGMPASKNIMPMSGIFKFNYF
jgi:hypothetical protein